MPRADTRSRPVGEGAERAAPEREAQNHAAGGEPEERVPLLQAAAADQLEDDREQDDAAIAAKMRRERGVIGSSERGTAEQAHEQRQRDLDHVVDRRREVIEDGPSARVRMSPAPRRMRSLCGRRARGLDLRVVVRVVGGEEGMPRRLTARKPEVVSVMPRRTISETRRAKSRCRCGERRRGR